MNVDTGKKARITYAPGADVLPVFSPDGTKLMWTSTRDGRPPSQLYIADFVAPESRLSGYAHRKTTAAARPRRLEEEKGC